MLEKSARMSMDRNVLEESELEWIHLLLMARDAGLSVEEVRQFLRHASAGEAAIRNLA
ncbi:hypothetical protein J41TS4_32190 [Paenibacillus apis]|uniref:Sin domain-containing protein n=1 Tax=Paenibacillus apis TaxID=1792174 RepID=A0A919Y248_9BACL|nr:hypothetical protein J41TS4_32190 [Paenibacillus apis]